MTDTCSGGEPWLIYFFRRHSVDDRGESVPGREFLDVCPTEVRGTMLAVLSLDPCVVGVTVISSPTA